jgi:hypothetical protein
VPGSESGGAVVRLPVVRPGVSSSVAVGGSRAYCGWQLGLPVGRWCEYARLGLVVIRLG